MRDARFTDFSDIRTAAARIAPFAQATPVIHSVVLDELAGASLFFKCEHLQRGGAFKFRGACNAVWALPEEDAAAGVVTQSSGNHGTAVALAAATRGLAAHIVVPEGAVQTKLVNIRRAGGVIYRCAPTLAAREEECARVQRETGANYVHPFADRHVVAGQGTAVLELVDQVENLDTVIVPVGGGGLASSAAIALAALAPGATLVGAEPAGADDAFQSMRAGHRVTHVVPDTICDGLRATIGNPNFEVLRRHDIEIVTVDDAATLAAMRLLWLELKQTVEPSSSIVLAALMAAPERFRGQRVGLVLTGGNVDLDAAPPFPRQLNDGCRG